MTDGTTTILVGCAVVGVALGVIGLITLAIAARLAKPEYRSKGFLRSPSGSHWFRFLLWKHYATFEDPSTRVLFGITHFCMMGTAFAVIAALLLLGQEYVFRGFSGLPSQAP